MSNNKRLKELLVTYSDAFTRACEESRKEALEKLVPGVPAPVPQKGIIHGAAYKERFGEECRKIRSEAIDILNAEADRIDKEKAVAPSEEAVRSISLFKMRGDKSIKTEDVDRLLDTYGGNYQAFKTITSIAHEKGIRTGRVHPLEGKDEVIGNLIHTFSYEINPWSAERGHASAGFCSMLGASIDEVFPEK